MDRKSFEKIWQADVDCADICRPPQPGQKMHVSGMHTVVLLAHMACQEDNVCSPMGVVSFNAVLRGRQVLLGDRHG